MDTNSLQQSQLDTPHKLALNPINSGCHFQLPNSQFSTRCCIVTPMSTTVKRKCTLAYQSCASRVAAALERSEGMTIETACYTTCCDNFHAS